MEKHRLWVFENRVLRRIYGPKREEVAGGWRRLRREELYNLYSTGWTIGALGFDSRRGLEIFLFITESRTALGTTQPPIQWVKQAFSLRVKRPGREADHSPPSSAEVKECVELNLHSLNTPSWRCA
jgi:hypothetical protein